MGNGWRYCHFLSLVLLQWSLKGFGKLQGTDGQLGAGENKVKDQRKGYKNTPKIMVFNCYPLISPTIILKDGWLWCLNCSKAIISTTLYMLTVWNKSYITLKYTQWYNDKYHDLMFDIFKKYTHKHFNSQKFYIILFSPWISIFTPLRILSWCNIFLNFKSRSLQQQKFT